MSAVDRLEDLLYKIGTGTGGSYGELVDVAADAVRECRDTPTPQIIRDVEELEALDPDTVFMERGGQMTRYVEWLPAVVVATGEQVRAARKALEEETDG